MWASTLPPALHRVLHRGVCVIATLGLLAGCAPGSMSTQFQRIGNDDGTDSCRRELVALDSTGNFFAEDIIKGAVIGALGGALLGGLTGGGRGALIGAAAGAALGGAGGYLAALHRQSQDQAGMVSRIRSDLQAEAFQIDRTQLAFSQLVECRFGQARAIRAAAATGRLPKPYAVQQMAIVRERAKRDLALARLIDTKIQQRGEQFDTAADQVSPGTKSYIADYKSRTQRTVVAQRPATLRLQPSASAPELAQIRPSERLTVRSTQGDYAVVETESGTRGYAALSSLQLPRAPDAGGGDGVRSLAGSNATRRDSFAQSVAVVESASATSFEIAG